MTSAQINMALFGRPDATPLFMVEGAAFHAVDVEFDSTGAAVFSLTPITPTSSEES